MKTIVALVLLMLPGSAIGAEYLEQVETEVYETSGTVKDVFSKAKACISQIVKNDEVRIESASDSDAVQGGNIFINASEKEGLITVNSRVDYKAKALSHNVKSTMSFLIKDGRFKMRHSNIEYLQKNTGSIRNSGYSRVGKWWGSGWKDTQKALLGLSDKIAECVKADAKKEEW